MKKLALALATSLALLLALSQTASASYSATCELSIEVLEVKSAPEKPGPKEPETSVKARFKVTKVHKGGGHNHNHCRDFPKRDWFEDTLSTADAALAATIKKGAKFEVHYRHYSNIVKERAVLLISWSIKPPKKP